MSGLLLSKPVGLARNSPALKHAVSFVATWLTMAACLTVFAQDPTPEPRALLDAMALASRELNYDGVFMYRSGTHVDTMRIIHKSGDNGVFEKLISLTGHPREVVRDKKQVKCYFPEDKTVVVDQSRLGKLISSYIPHPIESISDYYNFSVVGEGRVAGMAAWIVNIVPIDGYRYGYQLWIEKDSGLLLKSELKNQQGSTLEQVMFAQLAILNEDEIDESLLEPSYPVNDFTYFNNIEVGQPADSSSRQWQATWMPDGFMMRDRSRQVMATSEEAVEHLVYTDGLALVSVFVERLSGDAAITPEAAEYGGVNAYAIRIDDYQITAVGEVPKSTVKQMADSVVSRL